jgi:hypothetical protein
VIRAVEVQATIFAMGELYGHGRTRKPAPAHELLAQVDAGAAAVAARVGRWSPLLPTPDDLAEAQRCAEGLVRLLAELAQHVEGGGADAAA